jgi:hypothetical protein
LKQKKTIQNKNYQNQDHLRVAPTCGSRFESKSSLGGAMFRSKPIQNDDKKEILIEKSIISKHKTTYK